MVSHAPPYELPPPWIPSNQRRGNPDYDNNLNLFLPREVNFLRHTIHDSLGFNIRGGREHMCGIFISKVTFRSDAEAAGLQEGDQVISVNQVDFQNIMHSEAVHLLKSSERIHMVVRFFPYAYKKTEPLIT